MMPRLWNRKRISLFVSTIQQWWSTRWSSILHSLGIYPGIMPASTFVKDSKVQSNHTGALVPERGQHHYQTCRSAVGWQTMKNRSMLLFSQPKCEHHHSLHLLPGISTGKKKRKELQVLQHRFFFEDRANKSSGLWQTALHRIVFLFSLFHMTSQPQSFFFSSIFQDYISLCLIISFQVHTMKGYVAAAARTAGSVPSKIFLLMLLTCTSVYASA